MGKIRATTLKAVRDILKPYETVHLGVTKQQKLKSKIIESPIGRIVVVCNEKSLLLLKNAASKHLDRILKDLSNLHSAPIVEDNEAELLKSIELELDAYFKGDLKEFQTPIEIDTSSATDFQLSVWNEIRNIGYGQTGTFQSIANAIGKRYAARRVGNVCYRNPIAIVIPCHRVVAANVPGDYSFGTDKKKWLLQLEK